MLFFSTSEVSEWLKKRFSLRVILLLQLKNIRWKHLSIRIANTIISCQITTPDFACGVTSLTSTVPVAWNHKAFTSSPWMDDSHVSWSITRSHMTKHGISLGGFSIHFMLAVASHAPKGSRQREISNLGPCSDRKSSTHLNCSEFLSTLGYLENLPWISGMPIASFTSLSRYLRTGSNITRATWVSLFQCDCCPTLGHLQQILQTSWYLQQS